MKQLFLTLIPFTLILAAPAGAGGIAAIYEELPTLANGEVAIMAASFDGAVLAGTGRRGCCFSQAFRWSSQDGVRWLAPRNEAEDSSVRAISRDGQIILVETRISNAMQAHRWLPDGGRVAVTPVSPSHQGLAMNADGTVVGGAEYLYHSPADERPYLWSEAEGFRILPAPEGADGTRVTHFDVDPAVVHGIFFVDGPGSGDPAVPMRIRWRNDEIDPSSLAPVPDDTLQIGQVALQQSLRVAGIDRAEPISIVWMDLQGGILLGSEPFSSQALIWTRSNGVCRLQDWLRGLSVELPADTRWEGSLVSPDGRVMVGVGYRNGGEERVPWQVRSEVPLADIVLAAPGCAASIR
ncbi:hypothetical protein FJU31_17940 [Stenotrophomonas cyclobalanopsidis]|uniref:DUF3616 domain-containing protein n=1 Tax=Stenotrophomonas cyclobalanopsidis TaxID=2771362 RepID=A0ABQ6SWG3_9GAMM|nr:hypothetical protein [Stenotrophomonas cyclobalanopsidis]KAA8993769.1 hypothetical protein FJU31_17940 [Stenotrophomonas cyclobalanopsidis]